MFCPDVAIAGETVAFSCRLGKTVIDPEYIVIVSSLIVIEVEMDVTGGAVVVTVEVMIRELLAKYPKVPDKITRITRITTHVVCAKSRRFTIANQILQFLSLNWLIICKGYLRNFCDVILIAA